MKFHGTAHVSEIGTLQVPWNSMELLVSAKLAHSKCYGNSMEFHETEICTVQVPWNAMGYFCLLFYGTICITNTLEF